MDTVTELRFGRTEAVTGEPALEPLLRLVDLDVVYPGRRRAWGRPGRVRAVAGVSLDIMPGESVGLVGESGCGKSTIAKAIVRLVRPAAGSIRFRGIDVARPAGRDLQRLRRRIQIIFQDPYSSLDPRQRIGDIVAEPLKIHGLATANRAQRIAELLNLVGLDSAKAACYPHELSGGQRQRVGIARALAVEPELLVCDEPISALDVSIQAQILNLLCDLRERLGLGYLFISHNLAAVAMACDRIAVMYRGEIVEIGSSAEIRTRPAHPYTRVLLSAVPAADPVAEREQPRIVMPAIELPGDGDGSGGCRFGSRCWLHAASGYPDVCVKSNPQLQAVSSGHVVRCHFPADAGGADGEECGDRSAHAPLAHRWP